MSNEIEDKIKILLRKYEREIKKFDDLIKSGSSNRIEELSEILKKCQDMRGESESLLHNLISGLAGGGKQFPNFMDANYQLFMPTSGPSRKIEEIMVRKLEGSSMGNEIPSFKTPLRSRKKISCRFCEKPLYDETVALCSSCIRFKSKEEMLEYREGHPEELDEEGRLMRFPDLGS